MKEIRVESLDEFVETLNKLPSHYIYRGHSNAEWRLESALERLIGRKWGADRVLKFEDYSIRSFQSKFHLYDRENVEPKSTFSWLALMQHYGVPTRLLDFTESPYVALYFALEGYGPGASNDLALFSLDYRAAMKISFAFLKKRYKDVTGTSVLAPGKYSDLVVDEASNEIIWIAEPVQCNSRLDRQAGSFVFSGNRNSRLEDLLNSRAYESVDCTKYRIPGTCADDIFSILNKVNINSKSIYGDLGGLARYIRMMMQHHASRIVVAKE